MVLVEVELVTGWEADRPEDLVKVEEYSVQRVEHHKEDNKVGVAGAVVSTELYCNYQGVCAILIFNKYTYFWQFAYLSLLSM